MRNRRSQVVTYMIVGLTGAAAALLGIATNVVASLPAPWPSWLDPIRVHPYQSAGVLLVVGFVLAVVGGGWQERRVRREAGPLPPGAPESPPWTIDRPAELARVVGGLCRWWPPGRRIVGLHGGGGFGKTTLARAATRQRRVRRRFRGRVYVVTLGRKLSGPAAIAAKVNEVIRLVCGEDHAFTDPELAGQYLGGVLDDGPPRLLVLDDVWDEEQLAPFLNGGLRCARLVTTRRPGVLPGDALLVAVEQLTLAQARDILSWQLPDLPAAVSDTLLDASGRWPILLRLINRILSGAARTGADVPTAAAEVLSRLRSGGPAAVDGLTTPPARAIRATIDVSIGRLAAGDTARLNELGVFAEHDAVPIATIAVLWQGTAGLDEFRSRQVCQRLADLSLISIDPADGGAVSIHDVILEFLRHELGPDRLGRLHAMLLDAASTALPRPAPLAAAIAPPLVAWWCLPGTHRYLCEHLIRHLLGAGRPGEAEAVASDLRWVGERLRRFGRDAPVRDLTAVSTDRTARLRAAYIRTMHLLAATDPGHAVVDVLHSRVAHDPEWGLQVEALRRPASRARLTNRWRPPDLLDDAALQVMHGHTAQVRAVVFAPDSRWLASTGYDGHVRVWDAETGRTTAVFRAHRRRVRSLALAPDGTWLATASDDRTIRIWDVRTGRCRRVLRGHTDHVWAVCIAPDGTWLASAGADWTVRLWDATTGRLTAALHGHTERVWAVAIAPDGTWLASSGNDRTIRIWDAATGRAIRVLRGHTETIMSIAIAPAGTWLASGSHDDSVRIWDVATGDSRVLLGHASPVLSVVVSPDGTWLATAGADQTVRIWEAATGRTTGVLHAHHDRVRCVTISPDGRRLASGSEDLSIRTWAVAAAPADDEAWRAHRPVEHLAVGREGTWLAEGYRGTVAIRSVATGYEIASIRSPYQLPWWWSLAAAPQAARLIINGRDGLQIWDTGDWTLVGALRDHRPGAHPVAPAPDGSWIAVATSPNGVRILDTASGTLQQEFSIPRRPLSHDRFEWPDALAIAPDGAWLATVSNRAVRIWNLRTGRARVIDGSRTGRVRCLAIAPDSAWFATGGDSPVVRLWDSGTAQPLATLTGHAGPVRAIAVDSSGTWVATAGDDRTLRVWSLDGRCAAAMRVELPLTACCWIPSTFTLAAAGGGGTYLFDFLPADRVA